MTAEGSGPAEGTALGAGVTVPHTAGLMVLLTAMTALAPLSLQIFVPALPAIQASFGVSVGTAQLVLSLSILANAFATLAYGPLSDRFGRRPVVLGGLVAFIVGSIMCALAPDIGTLIAGRIVQAMGAAAGMVLARVMVRDLYDRERAASVIAYLTMAMVVAPMLAPTIGAVLTDLIGWRSIFTSLTVVGIVMMGWCARRLIETRARGAGGRLLTGAGALLASPQFLAYTLQMAFSIAVFFAFIAGAPYFMIDVLGRPATEYGLYFILVSAGFMAGNLVAARRTGRFGLDRMILLGTALALLGTLIALALLAAGLWTPLALFGPMMAVAFANGLTVPNAQAGAISVNPMLAGTASGLSGFAQMALAAAVSQAVGVLQNGTPYPMIGMMSACAALALLGFVLPRHLAGRHASGPGAPTG
jgi:DHA1 family bicyclomycin/chloramphenicol resistance-like MFS transporter